MLREDGGTDRVQAVTGERVGAHWLSWNGQRTAVDAEGRVSCVWYPNVRMPADVVRDAVNSGPGCEAALADAGLSEPGCDDTPGCSAIGTSWALALVPLLLARRRLLRR